MTQNYSLQFEVRDVLMQTFDLQFQRSQMIDFFSLPADLNRSNLARGQLSSNSKLSGDCNLPTSLLAPIPKSLLQYEHFNKSN